MTILRVDNITVSYGGVKALDNVGFELEAGTITALVGPNGSGKTTLLDVISGFHAPDSGIVEYKGIPIHGKAAYTVAKCGIRRTFQICRLFFNLSLEDNLLLAMENPKKETLHAAIDPRQKDQTQKLLIHAQDWLDRVKLGEKAHDSASTLSFGQRRLLELVRAIASDADLFLFDEPMAGLFPTMKEEVIKLFREQINGGKTICFIEHNLDTVTDVAHRVLVLDCGRLIADGPPKATLNEPNVRKAYFGDLE